MSLFSMELSKAAYRRLRAIWRRNGRSGGFPVGRRAARALICKPTILSMTLIFLSALVLSGDLWSACALTLGLHLSASITKKPVF